MGAIVYWAIVRFAIVMLVMWGLYSYIPIYSEWWSLFFIAVSVVVLYPAQLGWREQQKKMRRANQNALCATCRNFAERETLCMIMDEHVTRTYTPCEGEAWEPKSL